MWFFTDLLHSVLPCSVPAPALEEADSEPPRRTSAGSRLSDYGVPSQTQGIQIILIQ